MKKQLIPLLVLPMAVILWSCSDELPEDVNKPSVDIVDNVEDDPDDPTDQDFTRFITKDIILTDQEQLALEQLETMAFDLYTAATDGALIESSNGNFNLSPVSAAICFTMFANSLDEPYRSKVVQALGFKNIEQMNDITVKLLKYLSADGLGVSIALANSVWYSDLFTIDTAYKTLMNDTFLSPVSPLDFKDNTNAVDIINRWCSDHTNGLIKEVLSYLPKETLGVWANALYFLGKWAAEFDEADTDKAVFTGRDGSATVDMMHKELTTRYARTDDGEMVSLAFDGGHFFLDLILTNGEPLTHEAYKTLSGKCNDCIVDLSLPRFEITCTADLNKVFPALAAATYDATMTTMGIPLMYSVKDLHTIQKTSMTVNEKGAEAAAVTITFTVGSTWDETTPEHVKVVFDRPFSYVLRKSVQNTVLFVGQVNNL